MSIHQLSFTFWLLDVRRIWIGDNFDEATVAVLEWLSDEEQAKARAFYFLRDARMSIGSSLLKRLFVLNHIPQKSWASLRFARSGDPMHGKPCYVTDGEANLTLDFNVSHQAGVVVLAGCQTHLAEVGVDVVCVDERKSDLQYIDVEGFSNWVDMHAEVFSESDLRRVKEEMTSNMHDVDLGRRWFYAYWALKEAYVKLVGEGLLHNWMQAVEFRNVSLPSPAQHGISEADEPDIHERFGGLVEGIQVLLHGKIIEDVRLSLQSFEGNYIIATAVKMQQPPQTTQDVSQIVPKYKLLDIDEELNAVRVPP